MMAAQVSSELADGSGEAADGPGTEVLPFTAGSAADSGGGGGAAGSRGGGVEAGDLGFADRPGMMGMHELRPHELQDDQRHALAGNGQPKLRPRQRTRRHGRRGLLQGRRAALERWWSARRRGRCGLQCRWALGAASSEGVAHGEFPAPWMVLSE